MWVRIRQGWATAALVVVTGWGAVAYAEAETVRERAVPADRFDVPTYRTPIPRADVIEARWFPCLTGTRYSLVTAPGVTTMARDYIEVTPGFESPPEPTLRVVHDVDRGHWRAADSISRDILTDHECN
ncbi:hypothetical protein ACPEIF_12700 [Streptomyces sp. NPDC012600]|uniref:hypothetical protein n=1 Tax=Streptomyces sp. NPDC012600 TaxID=3415005 RepID=UPI003C2CC9FA